MHSFEINRDDKCDEICTFTMKSLIAFLGSGAIGLCGYCLGEFCACCQQDDIICDAKNKAAADFPCAQTVETGQPKESPAIPAEAANPRTTSAFRQPHIPSYNDVISTAFPWRTNNTINEGPLSSSKHCQPPNVTACNTTTQEAIEDAGSAAYSQTKNSYGTLGAEILGGISGGVVTISVATIAIGIASQLRQRKAPARIRTLAPERQPLVVARDVVARDVMTRNAVIGDEDPAPCV